MTITRTDTVHTAEHLKACYGQEFNLDRVETGTGEWRREPNGQYRFWTLLRDSNKENSKP